MHVCACIVNCSVNSRLLVYFFFSEVALGIISELGFLEKNISLVEDFRPLEKSASGPEAYKPSEMARYFLLRKCF